MKEGISAFKMLTSKLIGDKRLGVDKTTVLEYILKKQVLIRGIGLIRLRIGITGVHC